MEASENDSIQLNNYNMNGNTQTQYIHNFFYNHSLKLMLNFHKNFNYIHRSATIYNKGICWSRNYASENSNIQGIFTNSTTHFANTCDKKYMTCTFCKNSGHL